jgi:hypothetical protein
LYRSDSFLNHTATVIAYVGAILGLFVFLITLFNARKAVLWKRAELANTYMKDFNSSPELVRASRCLDWNGGKLIVPERLRPYLPKDDAVIVHDRAIFAKAVHPFLMVNEMDQDPRIKNPSLQISLDGFLSWPLWLAGWQRTR